MEQVYLRHIQFSPVIIYSTSFPYVTLRSCIIDCT